MTLVLVGTCALIAELGQYMHLEPVLAALAAGLVVENIASVHGDTLRDAVERGALPVLVIFFVTAGASLDLRAVRELGLLAVGIAVVRVITIRAGLGAGASRAGEAPPGASLAWMGLVSQAGVTVGLAIVVAARYPGWGTRLQTLVIALTTLHVVVGPVPSRAALAKAGEMGEWAGRSSGSRYTEPDSRSDARAVSSPGGAPDWPYARDPRSALRAGVLFRKCAMTVATLVAA